MVCHWLWMRKSGLNDSKQIDSLQSDQGHGLLAWLLWQGPVFCNMIHVYKSHMEQKTKLQYLFDISVEKENKRVLYSSFFFSAKTINFGTRALIAISDITFTLMWSYRLLWVIADSHWCEQGTNRLCAYGAVKVFMFCEKKENRLHILRGK